MKIRIGFVSNSSSSSFAISLCNLSSAKLELILNYKKYLDLVGMEYDPPDWEFKIKKGMLECRTSMTNFDLAEYCEKIGVRVKS